MSQPGRRSGPANIPPDKLHSKQHGEKDKVPGQRKAKASIKALIAEVIAKNPKMVRRAIKAGIRDSRVSHHHLRLGAEYLDGKPKESLDVTFHPDDLAQAKATLSDKMDTLLAAVLAKQVKT